MCVKSGDDALQHQNARATRGDFQFVLCGLYQREPRAELEKMNLSLNHQMAYWLLRRLARSLIAKPSLLEDDPPAGMA